MLVYPAKLKFILIALTQHLPNLVHWLWTRAEQCSLCCVSDFWHQTSPHNDKMATGSHINNKCSWTKFTCKFKSSVNSIVWMLVLPMCLQHWHVLLIIGGASGTGMQVFVVVKQSEKLCNLCWHCVAIVPLWQWRHLCDAVEYLESIFQDKAMDMQWHCPFATTKCNARVHPCPCSNWFHLLSKLYNKAVEWLWLQCASQHRTTVIIHWFLDGWSFIVVWFIVLPFLCHHCWYIFTLPTHQQKQLAHNFTSCPLFCWPGNAHLTLLELIYHSSTIMSIIWHHHHADKITLHSTPQYHLHSQSTANMLPAEKCTMMSSTLSPMLLWHSRWLHLQPCCNKDVTFTTMLALAPADCPYQLSYHKSDWTATFWIRFLHDQLIVIWMPHLKGLCHGHYFCATEGGRKLLLSTNFFITYIWSADTDFYLPPRKWICLPIHYSSKQSFCLLLIFASVPTFIITYI